ncbi:unnamed protein product, partial [Didymodactylos carnosus]
TDISCTQENLYRFTRALFPPELSVLKQICWRGYVDGLKFLQTRNLMVKTRLTDKSSISSVLGREYSEPNDDELLDSHSTDDGDVHHMFASDSEDVDDDSTVQNSIEENNDHSTAGAFSEFCRKPEEVNQMPSSLIAVFNSALNDELANLGNVVNRSPLLNIWSYVALPVTLPIDLTYTVTKRVLGIIPSFLPYTSTIDQSNFLPLNVFKWLFSNEHEDKKYSYHVVDCVCNDKPSSLSSRRYKRRRRITQHSHYNRANSIISTVTSSKSDSYHNREDEYPTTSTIMDVCSENGDLTDAIDEHHSDNESILSTQHLTDPIESYKPRIYLSSRTPVLNKDSIIRRHEQNPDGDSNQSKYKNELQQMADLSKKHFSNRDETTTTLSFVGKDSDNIQKILPITALEKSVVFSEKL